MKQPPQVINIRLCSGRTIGFLRLSYVKSNGTMLEKSYLECSVKSGGAIVTGRFPLFPHAGIAVGDNPPPGISPYAEFGR
jgi:hypothetical protein